MPESFTIATARFTLKSKVAVSLFAVVSWSPPPIVVQGEMPSREPEVTVQRKRAVSAAPVTVTAPCVAVDIFTGFCGVMPITNTLSTWLTVAQADVGGAHTD